MAIQLLPQAFKVLTLLFAVTTCLPPYLVPNASGALTAARCCAGRCWKVETDAIGGLRANNILHPSRHAEFVFEKLMRAGDDER